MDCLVCAITVGEIHVSSLTTQSRDICNLFGIAIY
jgi:hypothetical protein